MAASVLHDSFDATFAAATADIAFFHGPVTATAVLWLSETPLLPRRADKIVPGRNMPIGRGPAFRDGRIDRCHERKAKRLPIFWPLRNAGFRRRPVMANKFPTAPGDMHDSAIVARYARVPTAVDRLKAEA